MTAGLLQTGLLDELRIMVNPVILGQGRSLFAGAGKTSLRLLQATHWQIPETSIASRRPCATFWAQLAIVMSQPT